MTAPDRRPTPPPTPPGRCTDRSSSAIPLLPGNRAVQPFSAPESLPSAGCRRVPPASAEGGRSRATEQRTGSERRRLLARQLSNRDWAILGSLSQHAFLTTAHLQLLHFAGHASAETAGRVARRGLAQLAAGRLIEQLERRIGGLRSGSAAAIWRLGPVGDRLLRERLGMGGRLRRKQPSSYYLLHRLAVADAHVGLVVAARARQFELLDIELEPACWRRYDGPNGSEILKPDLFARTASGDFEDAWMVEIDRGTESLPTLLRKCAQYERYRRTGDEQRRCGAFPRVVWQLPHEARLVRLRSGLRAARSLDRDLFRLTTPEGFTAAIARGGAA